MNPVYQGASEGRPELKPGASVWVAASAGTGKTTVLTDRLLALMLDGTEPARILCLTFTRAAAAEMANRLNKRLGEWTVLEEGALRKQLLELTGREPAADDLARARQLFARVLDSPGGAKIVTIHAFCQSLLQRFPLEAEVPPEFAVLDERSGAEILAEAGEELLATAREGSEPGLAEALAVVTRYAAEERFDELTGALAANRNKLREAVARGEIGLRRMLSAALTLAETATVESVAEEFCAPGACDEDGLRAAANALLLGSKEDRQRAEIIAGWCAARDDGDARRRAIERYFAAYLTDKGEIRQSLITKPARLAAPDAQAVLQTEAARVLRYREMRGAAVTLEATCALVRLGDALLRAYERRKASRGLLDYDDLIERTLALLRRPDTAPWVLFKLDGGLDHILIDEAQDTNPEQWQIVAALTEEFFAGEDPSQRLRTVFAVGDAKQSIYSFQGADPHAFLEMRDHFQQRVNAASRAWHIVPLETSFRACEPLLGAIDAVFRSAEAADGVALDGLAIRHVAARTGQAGLVELWPPVVPDPEEPPDPEALPLARSRRVAPSERLAAGVAATIAGWLERGESLEARGRAMRPGDIMVLVRRRNEFAAHLLRTLKKRGVPVAGADRLLLTEQLAVQDLVALGRFLLLPQDNLTLAAVLKGPLFGLSEEALFDLAYGRGGEPLWSRLRRRAPEDLFLGEAFARLSALLSRADFVPPYELYAELLGAGGRRAILERIGPEAADPIDEFLALALAYEREHVPSLQGFLRWLVVRNTEVKRDFAERQRDEVRILTVHGAKGLEAPVVFLPDTMQLPDQQLRVLWSERDRLPLWCPRAEFRAPAYMAERAAWQRRQMQEYRRLLYVGLTRAEDRLYVCGWQTRTAPTESCWHGLCRAGWADIAEPFDFDSRPLLGDSDGWQGTGLRLTGPQRRAVAAKDEPTALSRAGPLPSWARTKPAPEPQPPRPLLPSRPSGDEPPALSPLGGDGRDRFKRGLLVHRLLQGLPELPRDQRETAARRFLRLPVHRLGAEEQAGICRETLAVLDHPEFAALWGLGSQAEVPVVGLIPGRDGSGGQALSGQIDRLVVSDDRVLIVDYKTLRPPPQSESEVSPLYLRQLAIYRAALARIYPGRAIECALLWTEGPRLMRIAAETLARHLP
ncbi:MAG: double-strand break repair helicase AddA [Alphaproteobacteria bacterium]|nr:double-strand break repair helicase AddA [Alphaproteobacteria bacterium]MBV9862484.1 double-strand break repair helicase AddA [Alphaproteobacteria bacterium]